MDNINEIHCIMASHWIQSTGRTVQKKSESRVGESTQGFSFLCSFPVGSPQVDFILFLNAMVSPKETSPYNPFSRFY